MVKDANITSTKLTQPLDNVAVVKYIAGIPGGRALDLSALAEGATSVPVLTVVVKSKEGVYSPLAITGGAYAALPEGCAYAGLLAQTVNKHNPEGAVMVQGVVNSALLPAPLPEAFTTAFPAITCVADEIA